MSRIVASISSVAFVAIFIACAGSGQQGKNQNPAQGNADGERQGGKPKVTAEDRAAYQLARAKAEKAAEAQNEKNRKAHELQVENLKAAFQKELDRYRSDKESYEKAMAIYKAAKAESSAASDLAVAREFLDSKKIEIANRRFREIITMYPNTQAAKDAKILLDGDYVAARQMPIKPIRPVEPTEPKLVLPPPPGLVAAVYPPDPDAVALADAPTKDAPVTANTGDHAPPLAAYDMTKKGSGANAGKVYVNGYTNKNGVYVQPHFRNPPGAGSSSGRR